MRVMGIDIQPKKLSWIILELKNDKGNHHLLPKNQQAVPTKHKEGVDNLLELKMLINSLINTYKVGKIAIVKATDNSSALRAKIELIAQLASREAQIGCVLVSPNTISFAKKGQAFAKDLDTVENIFF